MARMLLLAAPALVAFSLTSFESAFCQVLFDPDLRNGCPEACIADAELCGYGPGPCVPRKTLMQWSYGTSFSGGPNLDEPLVTDRPDFTEASSTVGLGVAQLEFGYTYTYDEDDLTSTRSHSGPETLLRYGILAEWLELRVAWNYADERARAGGLSTAASGGEDLYLGFKIALTPQECLLPEMAILPQMTVPTGNDDFTSDEVLPGVNWLYTWSLTDRIDIAGNTQANRALDDQTDDVYLEIAQSATMAFGLTERLGAYSEWYGIFPSGADTVEPLHFYNGGFTYLINNDFQLDWRAGLGLNDAADDYFVGAGAAMRF